MRNVPLACVSLAILTTQVFSAVLFVPGLQELGFSALRGVTLLVAVVFFGRFGWSRTTPALNLGLGAMVLLLLWMIVSLEWSQDFSAGIRQVSYMATVILLTYVLGSMLNTPDEFRLFARLFLLVGVFVAAFTFYESETGVHLFESKTYQDLLNDPALKYAVDGVAWFTFGNQNGLAVHLAIVAMMVPIATKNTLVSIVIALIVIPVALYLTIFPLSARLSTVSIVVYFLVCSFLSTRRRLTPYATLILLAPLLIICGLAASDFILANFHIPDYSSELRVQLLSAGVEMATRTLGVGVGAGGFPDYMVTSGLQKQVGDLVDPHNGFGRILGENGLIGLLVFIYIIVGPATVVERSGEVSAFGVFILAAVICTMPLLSINSDPLASSSQQLLIALTWTATKFVGCQGSNHYLNCPNGNRQGHPV